MRTTIIAANLILVAIASPALGNSAHSTTVEVTTTLVEFDRDLIENEAPLRAEGHLSPTHILKMWQDGKGELLATMSVATGSGVTAEVECLREITYPARAQGSNQADRLQEISVTDMTMPTHCESRQAGQTLNVSPTYDVASEIIRLTVAFELVEVREWYSVPFMTGESSNCVEVSVPAFESNSIRSEVSMENGGTRAIAGGTSDDGERFLYLLVTASAD